MKRLFAVLLLLSPALSFSPVLATAQQTSPQQYQLAGCISPVNDRFILWAGNRIAPQIRTEARSLFNTADHFPQTLSTIPTSETIIYNFLAEFRPALVRYAGVRFASQRRNQLQAIRNFWEWQQSKLREGRQADVEAALFACFKPLRDARDISDSMRARLAERAKNMKDTQAALIEGWIEVQAQLAELTKAEIAKKKEQERLRQTPTYVLGNSYVAFISVKRCWKHRLSYASIYISDAEMEQANIAIKRIEQKMRPGLDGGWTTDSLWQEADRRSQTNLTLNHSDGVRYQRDACQRALGKLLDEYKKHFPRDFATPKDF